jgi:hypothetical protein
MGSARPNARLRRRQRRQAVAGVPPVTSSNRASNFAGPKVAEISAGSLCSILICRAFAVSAAKRAREPIRLDTVEVVNHLRNLLRENVRDRVLLAFLPALFVLLLGVVPPSCAYASGPADAERAILEVTALGSAVGVPPADERTAGSHRRKIAPVMIRTHIRGEGPVTIRLGTRVDFSGPRLAVARELYYRAVRILDGAGWPPSSAEFRPRWMSSDPAYVSVSSARADRVTAGAPTRSSRAFQRTAVRVRESTASRRKRSSTSNAARRRPPRIRPPMSREISRRATPRRTDR